MRDGLDTLTDREKEALRLLLVGHDAKSVAGLLGLSVHTINERLRDARRKLDVSSSREAARLLARAEQREPDLLVDKQLGVSADANDMAHSGQANRLSNSTLRLAWFSGGMFIMSLVIAAAVLVSVIHGNDALERQGAQISPSESASRPEGLSSALDWITLLDQQRWKDSWDKAAALFQAGVSASQWASKAQFIRQSLGAASARNFKGATEASSLPGAPAGQYEIIQFQTNFAHKANAIETVVLAHDATGWKVAGYFIR